MIFSAETARKIAFWFGVIYVVIGVLGFIPGITVASDQPGHGLLLGIFAVNTLHNLVHLIAGAGLIAAGLAAPGTASTLLTILAVIFALLVPASFIAPIIEAVPLNVPDTLLHAVSALLVAYLAWSVARRPMGATV
jgi:hypothetical protein